MYEATGRMSDVVKEIMTKNFMEAMLRASLLLGDMHRTVPIREIIISGFQRYGLIRRLSVRCRITVEEDLLRFPSSEAETDPDAGKVLILFPE